MENKNILIGGGVLLVALYFLSKKKEPLTEEATEDLPSGGGGYGGFPMPTTTPAIKTETKPVSKPPQPTFPTCPTGQRYNPATRKCEPIVMYQQAPQDALRKAYDSARTAGGGLTSAPTGGGTTSGRTGSSSTAPPVSGSTTTRPVGGGGTNPTCPTGYMYNSVMRKCVKMDDGEVGGGGMLFSGKQPLTIDNLLC
jgi:hypothetical protein